MIVGALPQFVGILLRAELPNARSPHSAHIAALLHRSLRSPARAASMICSWSRRGFRDAGLALFAPTGTAAAEATRDAQGSVGRAQLHISEPNRGRRSG